MYTVSAYYNSIFTVVREIRKKWKAKISIKAWKLTFLDSLSSSVTMEWKTCSSGTIWSWIGLIAPSSFWKWIVTIPPSVLLANIVINCSCDKDMFPRDSFCCPMIFIWLGWFSCSSNSEGHPVSISFCCSTWKHYSILCFRTDHNNANENKGFRNELFRGSFG